MKIDQILREMTKFHEVPVLFAKDSRNFVAIISGPRLLSCGKAHGLLAKQQDCTRANPQEFIILLTKIPGYHFINNKN
jgi:hypothetical protein